MQVLLWILVAGVFLWAALFWMGVASRRKYYFEPGYGQIHFSETADGGRIALYRYAPGGGRRGTLPVILCHGLAANRFNFDLGEEASLARTLQRAGYDVWALELRGRGGSRSPRKNGPSYYRLPCSFDDYVRLDAPAAVRYVKRETGSSQVHWIGHSMGGMVLYGLLEGDCAREIASGVTVASPGRVLPPLPIHRSPFLSSLFGLLPALHLSFLSRGLVPLIARVHLPRVSRFLNLQNVETRIVQRALCFLTSDVTRGEILQFLRRTSNGDLCSMDGSYSYTENLERIRRPLFLIAGSRDLLATPESVEYVYARISSESKQICVLGKENGQARDYGHGDLVIGRACSDEVFPRILQWLQAVEEDQESAGRSA